MYFVECLKCGHKMCLHESIVATKSTVNFNEARVFEIFLVSGGGGGQDQDLGRLTAEINRIHRLIKKVLYKYFTEGRRVSYRICKRGEMQSGMFHIFNAANVNVFK